MFLTGVGPGHSRGGGHSHLPGARADRRYLLIAPVLLAALLPHLSRQYRLPRRR